MRRAFPAVLVLVLVVGAPLTTAIGTVDDPSRSASTARTDTTTTRLSPHNATRLTLDQPATARYNYSRPDIEFGTVVGVVDAELRQTYETALVETRVGAVPESAQAMVVERAVTDVEREVNQLRARERAAARRYANGTLSEAAFAREIAAVHARAGAIQASLLPLRLLSTSESTRDRILHLEGRLDTFRSPVREQLYAAARGEGSPSQVFVTATSSGVVLATVDDGQFHREAIRYDYRRPEQPPTITNPNQVLDRISELYPETNSGGDATVRGLRGFTIQQLYRVQIDHPSGPTKVYLDTASANVFYEYKTQQLSLLDTRTAINRSNDDLRLVVNRTYPTGPVSVRVYDGFTGQTVDARIAIDGEFVGRTGDDGHLWTVEPPNGYSLNASTESSTIRVTLTGIAATTRSNDSNRSHRPRAAVEPGSN